MMRAATHDGTFHADDVFSWAMLRRLRPELDLVRTRDPGILAASDIVFDVGLEYDVGRGRFDHHMRDRPLRSDGTPYSAFGLLWAAHGREMLAREVRAEMVEDVWRHLDDGLVIAIDRIDNGIGRPTPGDVSSIVDDFNPPWYDTDRSTAQFHLAADFAEGVLIRAIENKAAALMARDVVRDARSDLVDPRILVLPRSVPWEDAVFADGAEELLFVVYPKADGWYCTCVPPELGSFGQRLPLPEEWRGRRDADLARISGVGDATFCHPAGFICGARTREGAIALANRCLSMKSEPSPGVPT